MIAVYIYYIGCIVSFFILFNMYKHIPKSARDYSPEACLIYVLGTLCSWILVVLYLINRYANK